MKKMLLLTNIQDSLNYISSILGQGLDTTAFYIAEAYLTKLQITLNTHILLSELFTAQQLALAAAILSSTNHHQDQQIFHTHSTNSDKTISQQILRYFQAQKDFKMIQELNYDLSRKLIQKIRDILKQWQYIYTYYTIIRGKYLKQSNKTNQKKCEGYIDHIRSEGYIYHIKTQSQESPSKNMPSQKLIQQNGKTQKQATIQTMQSYHEDKEDNYCQFNQQSQVANIDLFLRQISDWIYRLNYIINHFKFKFKMVKQQLSQSSIISSPSRKFRTKRKQIQTISCNFGIHNQKQNWLQSVLQINAGSTKPYSKIKKNKKQDIQRSYSCLNQSQQGFCQIF